MNNSSVETIFAELCDMLPQDRTKILDARCAGNLELRAAVENLLTAHDRAGHFMAKPTVDFENPHITTVTEKVGSQIGRYKLLEQIGEGGFGVVYMAQQIEPVRRRVALKVIKLGMDTKQVIARFEAERQALAMMDHPHIARVLDGGATEMGRPYFVMELVRGDPITVYADREKLSFLERLELFVQVCNAIQHAHQKGIIHRDIKPSNVLVTIADGKPHAKVIDFGIAKATNLELTEKTIFTEFRQLIGTPQYMSPEQAERSGTDIDTRSDIYSLGVLLYEILTGSTPIDPRKLRSAAWGELQRMIREDDPTKPSAFISSLGNSAAEIARARSTELVRLPGILRRDLDWIVMKSLEKDRTRRYETASQLAEDVLRYIHDEPVTATPPSAKYKLQKFVRRNRRLIGIVSLLLMALMVGLLATTATTIWALREKTRALHAEQAAAEQAELARKKATDAATQAERAQRLATLAGSPLPLFSRQQLQDLIKAWVDDLKAIEKEAGPDAEVTVRAQAQFATWFSNQGPGPQSTALKMMDEILPNVRKKLGYGDSTFLSFVNACTAGHLAVGGTDPKYLVELYRDLIKSMNMVLGDEVTNRLLPEFAVELNNAGEADEAGKTIEKYLRQKDAADGKPLDPDEIRRLDNNIPRLAIWGETHPEIYHKLIAFRDSLAPPLQKRMKQFQQIGWAMLADVEANDWRLPPSCSYDQEGHPLLSWRVLLLNQLGESELYNQFHLDEPWDSEHNRVLIEKMPKIYEDPDPSVRHAIGAKGQTSFLVPVGDGTVFSSEQGTRLQEITDGTAYTLLALEVSPEQAVPWTKPDDWHFNDEEPLRGLRKGEPFVAAYCDGSVHVIDANIDTKEFEGLISPSSHDSSEEPVEQPLAKPELEELATDLKNLQGQWESEHGSGETPFKVGIEVTGDLIVVRWFNSSGVPMREFTGVLKLRLSGDFKVFSIKEAKSGAAKEFAYRYEGADRLTLVEGMLRGDTATKHVDPMHLTKVAEAGSPAPAVNASRN